MRYYLVIGTWTTAVLVVFMGIMLEWRMDIKQNGD